MHHNLFFGDNGSSDISYLHLNRFCSLFVFSWYVLFELFVSINEKSSDMVLVQFFEENI
jgi:hypothetical protein